MESEEGVDRSKEADGVWRAAGRLGYSGCELGERSEGVRSDCASVAGDRGGALREEGGRRSFLLEERFPVSGRA